MGWFRKVNLFKDFAYSTIAYALPTFALLFVIQPLIARHISGSENGLFLALLSIVRFCCNIIVTPLANLRLLEKQAIIKDEKIEREFNSLFIGGTILGAIVSTIISVIYMSSFNIIDVVLTVAFLCLLFFHDYYSIKFRIDINFKKVVIDNLLVVCGYFGGLALFLIYGKWQYIFIAGYLVGCIYVSFSSSTMWQSSWSIKVKARLMKRYGELSASAGFSKATVYCDRLVLYPILGGDTVSTYNAASVVSKVVSLVSVPVRSVLLSYIVGKNNISISRRIFHRLLVFVPLALVVSYFFFNVISYFLCKFLYPMFFEEASRFILVIVAACIIELLSGLLNIILLKYRKLNLQTIFSGVKFLTYLLSIFIFTIFFDLGLWGFCFATLLTTVTYFLLIVIYSWSCIKIVD